MTDRLIVKESDVIGICANPFVRFLEGICTKFFQLHPETRIIMALILVRSGSSELFRDHVGMFHS